jgi:hypothetical protein
MTIWKPVTIEPGLSHYEITDDGRCRNAKGLILKGQIIKNGYLVYFLYKQGKCRPKYAHQMVLHEFVGPCPERMEVNHRDGNKRNNHSSNLEYITHIENLAHARETGLNDLRGEANARSKLTEAQVVEIRSLAKEGIVHRAIARTFEVHPTQISSIVRRDQWKHVA